MGLDLLEIILGLEDAFDVAITAADWEAAGGHRRPFDITVGEVHFLVGAKLHEAGRPIPPDLGDRVQRVLVELIRVWREQITPELGCGGTRG